MDACSAYQKEMMLVETTVYYSAVEKALYLARLKEHSKVEMKDGGMAACLAGSWVACWVVLMAESMVVSLVLWWEIGMVDLTVDLKAARSAVLSAARWVV